MMLTAYRMEIVTAARENGIDPDLLEALVICESSGHADAFRFEPDFYRRYLEPLPEYQGQIARRVSSSYGLCQVMYSTARSHGFNAEPELLFLPRVSLDYGCKHLRSLLTWAEGNLPKAVAAYNGGKGNWDGAQPQRYAAKVMVMFAQVSDARSRL